jgi:hypothetical protein
VASIARGALAGTGAAVVPEEETAAALAFLGSPATLDDEASERLRGALSASVLYVIAVLPAGATDVNVALRTFDGAAPRSSFGRSTREALSGYLVGQLLSAPATPPPSAATVAVSAVPAAVPGPPTVSADGGLVVGQEVRGDTASGSDSHTPSCHAQEGSPDQTWRFSAPADGTYRFHVDAGYDAVLALHTPDGTELGCNRAYGSRTVSEIAATLVGGRTYEVVVDGFRGQTGSYRLRVDEGRPPAQSDVGLAIGVFAAVFGLGALTDGLGYYSACDQSPLCAGHPAISWIPIFGPWITLATQPLPGWSEAWYYLMGGIQLLFVALGVVALIPTPPPIVVDQSGGVTLSLDVGPTDGGAVGGIRGTWL